MKLPNVLGKAGKIFTTVAGSGLVYGLLAVSQGWKPPATGSAALDAAVGLGWALGGTSLFAGLAAGVARWVHYDPKKDPNP